MPNRVRIVTVTDADRVKLERRARDRGAPARVAERARIVLLSADGLTGPQIVGPGRQRRCCLRGSERGGAGPLPHPTVNAFAEHGVLAAVKEPAVGRGAVATDVLAEQVTSSGGIGTGRVAFLARCFKCRSS